MNFTRTSLLTGPKLPKPLSNHAMVLIEGDLVVIGGITAGPKLSSDLFRLTCANRKCKWYPLQHQLKIARSDMVAITIPNDYLHHQP